MVSSLYVVAQPESLETIILEVERTPASHGARYSRLGVKSLIPNTRLEVVSDSLHFFSIIARVPEGANGSGGPRAAPIAAPITQRSRKPPARGRRLIQPPDLLSESPGGSQPGEYTAASCTTGRWLRQRALPDGAWDGNGHHRPAMEAAHIRGMCAWGPEHSGRVAATMQPGGGYRGRSGRRAAREGFTALAILPAALPAGGIMVRCGRHWCRNICIGAGTGRHHAHGLR
jgi:hypothetical protein